MAETEQLVVQLEARIRDFERNFEKATRTANSNWNRIEQRSKQASARLEADMAQVSARMASSFQSVGLSLASATGLGGALGLTGILTTAVSVNQELAKMADIAKRVSLSTDQIQEIKFAANAGGVTDSAVFSGLERMASLLNESTRSENDLSKLFAANNLKLTDRQGKLIGVNEALSRAANLIRNAATEQDKIKIAEMLGLSREWVRALEGGSQAFNKAASEARSAGAVIDADIIRKAQEFDREWTKATAKWTAQVKAGAAAILPDLMKLAETAVSVLEKLSEFATNSVIASKLSEGIELSAQELRNAIALAKSKGSPVDPSWIADLERLEAAERKLKEERAKTRVTVNREPPPDAPKTVIPTEKRTENDQDAFTRAQDAARKRIALVEADTRAVGLNEAARERLRTVAELEEAARRANRDAGLADISVTDQQRAAIDRLADATERAAQTAQRAKQQWQDSQQTISYLGNIGIDVWDRMAQGGQKFSDVLADVSRMLAKAAAQAFLLGEGPLAGLFGTKSATGGVGGLVGSLFGGFRAEGGPVSAGRAYVVGEERPEVFVPKTPGTILPSVPSGGSVTSNSTTINAPVTVNVQGGGGTPEQNQDLADRIGKTVQAQVREIAARELRQQMRPGGMLNHQRS